MTTHRRSRIRCHALLVIATVISSLMAARPLVAQGSISCSGEPCVTAVWEQTLLVVPVLSQLTTSASTFSIVPTGGLTATHFNAGNFQADAALTLTVQTNAISTSSPTKVALRWRATSGSFTSGCGISSASDLRYGLTSGTRTSSVPTTETLLSDNITASVSPATITLFFRVNNLQWTNAPAATCELPLAFSIAP
jgi:hypothetical protein